MTKGAVTLEIIYNLQNIGRTHIDYQYINVTKKTDKLNNSHKIYHSINQ